MAFSFNKEVRQRKKELQAEQSSGSNGKRPNKIVLIGVGVVVLFIIIAIIMKVVGGSKDKTGILENVLNVAQQGHFTYQINVKTSPLDSKEDVSTEAEDITTSDSKDDKSSDASSEDTSASTSDETTDNASAETDDNTSTETSEPVASGDTTTAEPEATDNKNVSSDWNSDEVRQDDAYLDYAITLDTVVNSVEPLELETKISTNLHNQKYKKDVTDFIIKDDTVYVGIAMLKEFCEGSGVIELENVGTTIPSNGAYISIPVKEFKYYIDYVNTGEREETALDSPQKFLMYFNGFVTTILRAGTGEDGNAKAVNLLTSITNGSGYQAALMNTGYDSLDDKRKKIIDNSIVNYNKSKSGLSAILPIVSDGNVEIVEEDLTQSDGTQGSQATVKLSCGLDDTFVSVAGTLNWVNSGQEIKVPESVTPLSDYYTENTLQMQTDFNKVFNYFNPLKGYTKIGYHSDKLPVDFTDEALESFANFVNSVGVTKYHITKDNAKDFIKKYYQEDVEKSAESKLINDYLVAMYNVTDGLVHSEVTESNDTEQYPKVKEVADEIEFTVSYNKAESEKTQGIMVLDVTMKNKSTSKKNVDLTSFKVQDLIPNIYPVNNLTTLKNVDSNFNMSELEDTITLNKGETHKSKLYVTVNDASGYMDIWYNTDKLGVVVAY